MKEPLLYLCHRIPYPPNKGDKITTYNILKFLSRHFDVYLGCFIDDPYDNRYQSKVQALCKEAFFIELNTLQAKVKGLSAFISGKPITLPHYYSSKMQRWVSDTIVRQKINKAFIYSGCMAQYVLTPEAEKLHKIMQFADIDSDKWRQYADKTSGLMRWIYLREQRTLAQYEKHVADEFTISCFISDAEAAMFRNMVDGAIKDKVQTLSNGIDSDYFSPTASSKLVESYPLKQENYVVFTGAMDYRPNVDAVVWFARSVWPQIIAKAADSKFYIVGSAPPKQVLNLQQLPGIVVTGRVEDVRPYLLHAKAAIAPMKIARGIQNKILEAMAMERPVITSQLGIEGLENYPNENLYITDSPEHMAHWIIDKLTQETYSASESRQWLKENFSWEAKLSPLLGYLGAEHD